MSSDRKKWKWKCIFNNNLDATSVKALYFDILVEPRSSAPAKCNLILLSQCMNQGNVGINV